MAARDQTAISAPPLDDNVVHVDPAEMPRDFFQALACQNARVSRIDMCYLARWNDRQRHTNWRSVAALPQTLRKLRYQHPVIAVLGNTYDLVARRHQPSSFCLLC